MDLFDALDAEQQCCATCPLEKAAVRCPGAWFPDERPWKEQYCTRTTRTTPDRPIQAYSEGALCD